MNDYLAFGASAPFIYMVIGFIKTFWLMPSKVIPLITMALAALWGAVLVVSGYFDGNAAQFILTMVLVATSASGIQSQARTYVPEE